MSSVENIGGFISAPIRLAALIKRSRDSQALSCCPSNHHRRHSFTKLRINQLCSLSSLLVLIIAMVMVNSATGNAYSHLKNTNQHEHLSKQHSNEQPRGKSNSLIGSHLQVDGKSLRHHAHYLNIDPSTHFSYNEGRQFQQSQARPNEDFQLIDQPQASGSQHIYKRSSALISSPGANPQYPPLVTSTHYRAATHHQPPALIRRRMMSEGVQGRWLIPDNSERDYNQAAELLAQDASESQEQIASSNQLAPTQHQQPQPYQTGAQRKRNEHEAAELLRQKQHIQYHDQMPSMAGKCHKRTLNFCASVLPFNTTTFPNIIGDTNRFEVKRSLPFFGFLAKSSCNARLDELLCLLLEPPCSVQTGVAIPPCKKFCRLALEGCNEYIPATLAMSSVFDCRQYPDSSDPNVCINLAQGSKCAPDEFKCPDKTCIPRNWLCDGVRDCVFAADEANCTVPTGVGLQTSVCSTEEFKCDGKCVPKAWRCDNERDCQDGSDEESCDLRPRCGPDRFTCADGNGCLPKRWRCDGRAECRDGSDELNCEQEECSVNDFKCDNGICIPKLWRCDKQSDCKDGSDERNCIYPTSPNVTSTTTQVPTTQPPAMTTTSISSDQLDGSAATMLYPNVSLSATLGARMAASAASAEQQEQQVVVPTDPSLLSADDTATAQSQQLNVVDSSLLLLNGNNPANHYLAESQQQQQPQQLESNLNEDVSRIIRQESSSIAPALAAASSQAPEIVVVMEQPQAGSLQQQQQQQSQSDESRHQQHQRQVASKEMNKFDYDIIPSSQSGNLIQLGSDPIQPSPSSPSSNVGDQQATQKAQVMTQIDFVPHQQQQPRQHRASQQRNQYFNQQAVATIPTAPVTNKPQVSQQHRVPIYRSLFKSLKGGQGRFANSGSNSIVGGGSGHSHASISLVGRRRRDRTNHQLPQQHVMTTQAAEELAKLIGHHWSSQPTSVTETLQIQSTASSPTPHNHQFQRQQVAANQTRAGVASYLQMLNSRYNLRLSRTH